MKSRDSREGADYRTLVACTRVSVWPCFLPSQPDLPRFPIPLKLVDPLIGTGPEGHTFPGATAPFGMVQLSPDTQIRPFKQSYKWAAGYRYEDTTILGFSHTHFSGAGHSDLGDVLLMPVSGDDVPLEPGDPEKAHAGISLAFLPCERTRRAGLLRCVPSGHRASASGVDRKRTRRSYIATPFLRERSVIFCSTCAAASTTIPAKCCGLGYGYARTAP